MSKPKPRLKPDDAKQSRLFIEKAREIGASNKRTRSDELIGHLAKKPPEPRVEGKKRKA